jgi:hypothetical protein
MPLLAPPPVAVPARGDKRRLAIILACVVLVLGAAGIWAVVQPGSYGGSARGCVTVTVPSSTGGGLLHECGARARSLCRNAEARHDKLALLIRPQCRKAGLG